MNKSIKIGIFVLCIGVLLTFSGCKKIHVIDEENGEEYINAYYDYFSGEKTGFVAIDLRILNPEYSKGHLKGFISYQYEKARNLGESDTEYRNRMSQTFQAWIKSMYSTKLTVFLIDTEGEIVLQEAPKLQAAGYKRVYIYTAGYVSLAKQASNLIPIATGTDDCGC